MTFVKIIGNGSLMNDTQILPVSLSDRAAVKLAQVRIESSVPDSHYLRIGVKGGGCSGMSYVLDFEEKGPFDEVFNIKGIEVVVDKRHTLYISGMEVDHSEGLNDRGFVFNNPLAKTTCGCGESFSA